MFKRRKSKASVNNHTAKSPEEKAQAIIGKVAFVIEPVNNSSGKILVSEEYWPARTVSFDAECHEDTLVVVVKVKNGMAFVEQRNAARIM